MIDIDIKSIDKWLESKPNNVEIVRFDIDWDASGRCFPEYADGTLELMIRVTK